MSTEIEIVHYGSIFHDKPIGEVLNEIGNRFDTNHETYFTLPGVFKMSDDGQVCYITREGMPLYIKEIIQHAQKESW